MKKICSYLVAAIALFCMAACTPNHDKTVANLKAAIDGESTASAKYAAFAEQAAKDSLFSVEALFKTTSQAEAIHIKNHQAALAKLGVTDYQGKVSTFEVKSTAENLQAAIDGETYEFNTMYPNFIADATKEKVQEALISFNYAQDAEKVHARIYSDVLSKLATPEALPSVYYLCPKCGNVFDATPTEPCALCQTGTEQFMIVKANLPMTDAHTGATAQPAAK